MSDFEIHKAKRARVPLIVGLYGPSGSGKTYTALRIATGIQSVVGGKIACIDTEAGRALHYADFFDFHHIPFEPPHSSRRYLEALRFAKSKGATVTIVDSTSHEHEGEGGLLEYHTAEVQRMARGDARKAEAVKMLAWSAPKQDRRKLINGLVGMGGNVILCFRAKQSSKPVKTGNKTEVVNMGFVPIGADELAYESTLNALLPPQSGGVPDWNPQNPGERQMVKLPRQFEYLRNTKTPLDEEIGERLAKWAEGGAAAPGGPSPGAPSGESPSAPPADDDRPKLTDSDRKRVYAVMGERATAIGVTKEQMDVWLHHSIKVNRGLDSMKEIPRDTLPKLLERIATLTEDDVAEACMEADGA